MTYRPAPSARPGPRTTAAPRRALGAAALVLAVMVASACTSGGAGGAQPEAETPADPAAQTGADVTLDGTVTPDVAAPLPAAPPGPDSADGRVLCFYGPVTQTPRGGEATVAADLAVRRTLEPGSSRVVEETVRIERAANRRTRPYRTIYEIDGNRFELREESGAFAGTGTLEGEPWRWSAWDMDYRLESGIRVTGRYEFRPAETDGGSQPERYVLVGDKTAYGPDGAEALSLHEELKQVSRERCAELLEPAAP